jgi:multicomponent K+:H+ antiporter subunit F
MNTVFAGALWFAQLCLVVAMVCAAYRLMRGPSAHDRVLAVDTLNVNCMLTLLMLGMRSSSTAYFDMALLMGLFGFAGSTALAKFLLRGEVIEP